jgi:glycosyltransferase involved in cell wall biosynthesis
MYLIITHVPIYTRGNENLIDTDWKRSLILLRNSFAERLGPISVLAPTLPDDVVPTTQIREVVYEKTDGIKLFPSFDKRCRARRYWLSERHRWIADIKRLLPYANVAHSALDDLYKPISYYGHLKATDAGIPTVYVQDGDAVQRLYDLSGYQPFTARLRSMLYAKIFEQVNRKGIRSASLVLLKGRSLVNRYGNQNKNHKNFADTSYSRVDIISKDKLEVRLASLIMGRPLRLIFFGRLIWEKGIDESIKIIKLASDRGVDVMFDIIGNGPDRQRLGSIVNDLNIGNRITFHDAMPYGPGLMAEIQKADMVLFTSRAEETPRMIFDGYSAGMPLTGYPISYLLERADEDGCCLPMEQANIEAGADMICDLARNPEKVIELSRKARKLAEYHCAEAWYNRRAEWTFEMLNTKKYISENVPA